MGAQDDAVAFEKLKCFTARVGVGWICISGDLDSRPPTLHRVKLPKGWLPGPKSMNFRKTSEWGGGHFRSEKFRCGFSGNFGAVKTMNFRKKGGGHANPNEFRCKFLGLPKKAQHCFPKIGWGGVRGRLEVFRKFIEFGTDSLPLLRRRCLTYAQFNLNQRSFLMSSHKYLYR